ncbi:MAG TPA: hypothetical protein VN329_08870 [Roseomonas sp.]|nr:hypothetical protein [Roseomonas sp.]
MLDFPAWRSLARDSGLDAEGAVAAAVAAIRGVAARDAADPLPPRRDLL